MTSLPDHTHPALERQVDRVEQRLDRIERRLDRLETNMDQSIGILEEIVRRLTRIEDALKPGQNGGQQP